MMTKPIVHMIWIGSPLPDRYLRNIQSYKNMGYEVKLWTHPPFMKNRDVYDAMRTWAGKADVMRLEILLQEGGIYTDIDSRMIAPLPLESDLVCMTSPNGYIANETIYATKGHPALQEAVDDLILNVRKLHGETVNIWDIAGAKYITPIFTKYPHKKLERSLIGRVRNKPKFIAHDYHGSWRGLGSKAQKHVLDYWLDEGKL